MGRQARLERKAASRGPGGRVVGRLQVAVTSAAAICKRLGLFLFAVSGLARSLRNFPIARRGRFPVLAQGGGSAYPRAQGHATGKADRASCAHPARKKPGASPKGSK